MLTADNVTVYGSEVDSLQETGQQQLVSNKLYVSRFYCSLLNCTVLTRSACTQLAFIVPQHPQVDMSLSLWLPPHSQSL